MQSAPETNNSIICEILKIYIKAWHTVFEYIYCFTECPFQKTYDNQTTKKNNLTQQPQYDVNVELITH
jgi:hypothetical protein